MRRDPFARGNLDRECEPNSDAHASCAWCGQKPRRLYRYIWNDDASGTRRSTWSELYCNLSCYDCDR